MSKDRDHAARDHVRHGAEGHGVGLPGLSIGTRALLGALTLVVLSVCVSGLLFANVIEGQIERSMSEHARKIGDELAPSLIRALELGDQGAVAAIIERSMTDARVSFITVDDARGYATLGEVRDGSVWTSHRVEAAADQAAGRFGSLNMTTPILSGKRIDGYAYRKALWSEGKPGAPVGIVSVGVVYHSYSAVRARLRETAALTACGVALGAAPLVIFITRRHVRPIRLVARAAESLASGRRPEPLPERGGAELATLSRSFNVMTRRLSAAQDALLAANRGLEATVQSRTDELRRVNDLLRLEIKDRNEFIRTVTHDLNAPLRNIAGMTALLMEDHAAVLPDEARRRLERIAANVELESEMIDGLLELSRLADAASTVEEVDSGRVARDVARAFEHDLRDRDIELEIADDLPVVSVEPPRLRTVLQNLVDNAIKHMGDAPERRVRVSCELGPEGAAFTVADTGPGIPEHEHAHVFDVFHRGEGAVSGAAATPGKGIGLAAVRSVVERWSGKITLESAPGRGARFTFTLPRERVVDPALALSSGCAGDTAAPGAI